MSILINGMEMPTSPVLFCIHPDGKVFADLEGGLREYQAVPVPPHGRLIDADALCVKLKMMYAQAFGDGNSAYHSAYRSLEKVVEHEPTVIDADKEGGE